MLDIAMNENSLFLSYGDGRRTKNASVSWGPGNRAWGRGTGAVQAECGWLHSKKDAALSKGCSRIQLPGFRETFGTLA